MTEAIMAIQSASASLNGGLNGLQSQMQTQSLGTLPALNPAMDGTGVDSTNSAPFADLMTDYVGEVNKLQDQASRTTRALMTGKGVDVHEAMIDTEKATMAFELTLAVRNKAVQAYQQVMSMQF
jgi:flagellar hook-basal body complex protein FliE